MLEPQLRRSFEPPVRRFFRKVWKALRRAGRRLEALRAVRGQIRSASSANFSYSKRFRLSWLFRVLFSACARHRPEVLRATKAALPRAGARLGQKSNWSSPANSVLAPAVIE